MRTDTPPKVTRLSEYTPFPYEIESVELDFDLHPERTLVSNRMRVSRKDDKARELELDGEDITLKRVLINGIDLKRSEYRLTQKKLYIPLACVEADIEIINECAPAKNTQLMGLYMSGGRYCTQCEAEGFRRITFFPDRPDVMSVYRVRISAPKADFPTLLANGNLVNQGDLDGGKHFAVWEDPFRKPSYLFALVAGKFDLLEDSFTTMSDREIALQIYSDPGDKDRTVYAMNALKRSMAWDETAFGREYDLDRFMIVAVRDFNFGAMENKGLNIFNSALLLADPKRATDANYERIESVVAHEYFHNWTGNRITCRDWFQLCLKEGFTVFRDQEFSADQRERELQRIKDVKALRARQFPEDAGPLAHAVRPQAYEKIDNFYTATIYEKGAELVRMLRLILGPKDFRKGCDHYFKTLDGTASTVEDFIASFEAATGRDLSGFMTWYHQAGTPTLSVATLYNHENQELTLKFKQNTPPTPGQKNKKAVPIPVALALVSHDGKLSHEQTFVFEKATDTLTLSGVKPGSTPSLLRGFSSPVLLDMEQSTQDKLRIMAHETDLFARWEAGQNLGTELFLKLARAIESGDMPAPDRLLKAFITALGQTLDNTKIDDGFKALALTLPSVNDIITRYGPIDPLAVVEARALVSEAIAFHLKSKLDAVLGETLDEDYSPDYKQAGYRALQSAALSLSLRRSEAQMKSIAQKRYDTASNMTDELSSLMALVRSDDALGGAAGETFYKRWKDDPLTLDKWFMVQAARTPREPIAHLEALLEHQDFDPKNPNRVRALLGGLAGMNPKVFHRFDGSGYRFFTDQVMKMDKLNPSVAARLLGIYEIGPKLDKTRKELIRIELKRVIAQKPSDNVREIAGKLLG